MHNGVNGVMSNDNLSILEYSTREGENVRVNQAMGTCVGTPGDDDCVTTTDFKNCGFGEASKRS